MKIKQNNNLLFLTIPIFIVASFVIASECAPSDSSAVQQVSVTAGDYSLTIDAPDVSLNVGATTPSGTYISSLATTHLFTNAPGGYQMYFSMNNNTNHDNRLYLSGDSTSAYISPTAGTFDNPAALTTNTWGWAVKSSDVISEQTGSFDSSYATPTPTTTSKWAAMPTYGNDRLLARSNSPTSESGIDVDIYYGAFVNTAVSAGTYSGDILYTALADSAVQDSLTVSPATVEIPGSTLTLGTTLFTAASDFGNISVTIDDATCANPTPSTTSGYLTVSCVTPEVTDGTHTVTLNIEKFGKTYSSTVDYHSTVVRSFSVTAVSDTDLSTQKEITIDTNLDYTSKFSMLEAPTAGTVTVGNASCAGTVTASNNNGNIRYTCSSTPKNLVGSYDIKLNLTNVVDSSATSATYGTQATYAASTGSGELSVSPASAAPSTAQAVTITTTLSLGTGITESYGTVTASVNGVSCTNAAASLSNGVVTVTCEAPGIATEGTYDVSVGVGGYSYNKTSTGVYEIKRTCVDTLGGTDLATGTYQGYSAKIINGECWMMSDYRTNISWNNIMNGASSSNTAFSVQGVCPNKWYVPTRSQFNGLIDKYGYGSNVYYLFGLSASSTFWSSTETEETGSAYYIYTNKNGSGVDTRAKDDNRINLRCVAP